MKYFSKISKSSVAEVSEFLENLGEMFPVTRTHVTIK